MRLTGNQIAHDLAVSNHVNRPAPRTSASGEVIGLAATPATAVATWSSVTAVADLLPAEDRRLFELIFVEGLTHQQAAELQGVDRAALSRRVRRLRRIIACPTRRAVAANLHSLAPEVRGWARDYFFHGYSVRLMAVHRKLPRTVVQREVDFIRGWARALQRADRLSGSGTDDAASVFASASFA